MARSPDNGEFRAMSKDDQRLATALILLRDQLAPVVDEITFGELDAEDRRHLSRALHTVADALAPIVDGELCPDARRET